MLLHLESYRPQNELLKKYVSYFYFQRNAEKAFRQQYSFFPHLNTTLSFYHQAAISGVAGTNHIRHSPRNPPLMLLTRQHSIQTVVQGGPLDKIGIVFYPLGLNHFISEPYNTLAPAEVQYFTPANQALWLETIGNCFSRQQFPARQQLLEDFLVSLYRPKTCDPLYAVLKEVGDPENTSLIKDIAGRHFINHRKLNRDFARELAISPETYRMIARFRYAVNKKIMEKDEGNLTGLSYASGYGDQPYMIRTFKKLTGLTPTAFFREGRHLGVADTFWKP